MTKRFALMFIALAASAQSAIAQAATGPETPACTIVSALTPLSADVRETSGLARGRVNADVIWTHNDSGNHPEIFALGMDGAVRARVSVRGVLFSDWEDMEGGACASGHCLYIADIGDNGGEREHVTIYEVPEPALPASAVEATRAIKARFADGPQDAEALFRLPSGDLYIVTKGRQKSIKLYRLDPAGADGYGTLKLLRELAPQPRAGSDRVTAATASPNGEWVAIRSYSNLQLYRTTDLLAAGGAAALTYSLLPVGERQGESLALADDGSIWMTSEAERGKDLPTMSRLKCTL